MYTVNCSTVQNSIILKITTKIALKISHYYSTGRGSDKGQQDPKT